MERTVGDGHEPLPGFDGRAGGPREEPVQVGDGRGLDTFLVEPRLLEAGRLRLGAKHVGLSGQSHGVAGAGELLDVPDGSTLVSEDGQVLAGEKDASVAQANAIDEIVANLVREVESSLRLPRLDLLGEAALAREWKLLADRDADARVVVGAWSPAVAAVLIPQRRDRIGERAGLGHPRPGRREGRLGGPELGALPERRRHEGCEHRIPGEWKGLEGSRGAPDRRRQEYDTESEPLRPGHATPPRDTDWPWLMGAPRRVPSSGSDQMRRIGGAEDGPVDAGSARANRGTTGAATGTGAVGSGAVTMLTGDRTAGAGSEAATAQQAGAAARRPGVSQHPWERGAPASATHGQRTAVPNAPAYSARTTVRKSRPITNHGTTPHGRSQGFANISERTRRASCNGYSTPMRRPRVAAMSSGPHSPS